MSADADIGLIEARLEAFDAPIRKWLQSRERAFGAAFGAKEGKLSSLMSRLPKAAAASAGVREGPRDQVYELLDEICDIYARSDPQRCAVLRGVVQQREVVKLLEGYVLHAAEMLRKGGRPEWLDRALAAASIEDQRHDYRDWLMNAGEVYLAAREHGIDPAPAFARMAERSNPEPHPATVTPTRDALAGYERSAYFRTSILPRMR